MGSIVNKYKVNELAKDFGLQTREIIDILGQYFDVPKKSGQNLDERELTVVFEHLTQHNQVSGLQAIFADTAEKTASESTALSVVFARLNGITAGTMSGRITSADPYQNHTPMVRFAATDPAVASTTPIASSPSGSKIGEVTSI